MSPTVLAITGSYRPGGISEQLVEETLAACHEAGCACEHIDLKRCNIAFCSNCRACTQAPGEQPGACPLQDDMADILAQIERADGLVLAAPTNFFSVTALFKRFLERLVCMAYWPWGVRMGPVMRRKARPKRALLISSCAAPGLLGRVVFGSLGQLKLCAKALGARVVGKQLAGMVAIERDQALSPSARRRARRNGRRLARALGAG